MTPATSQPPTDGQILADFADRGTEEAFATILQRHAPMVLAVSRSVLGNTSDAEDAAQAVFLTLAQKAASLKNHNTVAGWLHRVAWYITARAAEARAIRRRHEQEAARMKPEITPAESEFSAEELHASLQKLPEKYRVAIILHHLEGRTEEETAALLACSPSAATARLSRGRRMLRQHMNKRGAAITALALAAALSAKASAGVPPGFVSSTAQIAALLAAGKTVSTSATVLALSKGALQMIRMAKMKIAAALILSLLLLGGTGTYLAIAGSPGAPPPAAISATAPAGPVTFHFVTPPAEVSALVKDSATRVAGRGPAGRGAQAPADVTLRGPLAVYQLRSASWDSITQMGFVYIVESQGKQFASIEVRPNSAGKYAINTTSFVAPGTTGTVDNGINGIDDALDHLQAAGRLPTGSYEVRFIHIPTDRAGLPSVGLWIKADNGGEEYIYTYFRYTPGGLKQGELYSPDQYVRAVGRFIPKSAAAAPKPEPAPKAISHPKDAVTAALDLIQILRKDTAFVSNSIHRNLLIDLDSLEAAATAVTQDTGTDQALTAQRIDAFSVALTVIITRANDIGNRATETREARDKSIDLAAKLTAIAAK
ncbi:MAG TPA: sigma-70 family RNA polymerase sigma factor [Phycisphaerae bacterium]